VRNILNVKHRITKGPLSLFFIDLEPKEHNKGIYDMEFLCNMKITVEAPRPKNTSSNAQNVNLMVIQKHTVQNHMPALNVEETTTQPNKKQTKSVALSLRVNYTD
jgi:hypothetical protein